MNKKIPKKAKLVLRRQTSFPRRNVYMWDFGVGYVETGVGAIRISKTKMLDLKTGEIYTDKR